MYKLLLSAALLAPLASQAQSSSPALPSHYFGLGLNGGYYYDRNEDELLAGGLVYRPAVIVGIPLLPRFGLQLSATTYKRHSSYLTTDLSYTMYGQAPDTSYSSGDTRSRIVLLPMLLRYTLSARPRRVQVDGLFGPTLFMTRNRSTYAQYDSRMVETQRFKNSSYSFNSILTLGLGLRYAVTPHLELASEARLNAMYMGYYARLNPNVEVSLRYCLKPATTGQTTRAVSREAAVTAPKALAWAQ
ncbi:outer membrane beta-barrel protein [Hymenobacter rigui]|uniref:Outer membrane protein beta-barrel domain-containing protein n=1 Tax=Hymenobacter rigui TaxID=334424 RepID=A0A428KFD7_9BACT|nr:outer membrane beta-barrel protein [Hymenobacter rigui]RSK45182.1 hypothetical protein EI291_18905 [Hymenobacter rigui]